MAVTIHAPPQQEVHHTAPPISVAEDSTFDAWMALPSDDHRTLDEYASNPVPKLVTWEFIKPHQPPAPPTTGYLRSSFPQAPMRPPLPPVGPRNHTVREGEQHRPGIAALLRKSFDIIADRGPSNGPSNRPPCLGILVRDLECNNCRIRIEESSDWPQLGNVCADCRLGYYCDCGSSDRSPALEESTGVVDLECNHCHIHPKTIYYEPVDSKHIGRMCVDCDFGQYVLAIPHIDAAREARIESAADYIRRHGGYTYSNDGDE